jgi:signal transduction histidine kinase
LKHLLDDVTNLRAFRREARPASWSRWTWPPFLIDLCEGMQAMAEERGLYLKAAGPSPFVITGDRVKTRRLAQNLILNALTYTREGGVAVSWEDTATDSDPRWTQTIEDTGRASTPDPVLPWQLPCRTRPS